MFFVSDAVKMAAVVLSGVSLSLSALQVTILKEPLALDGKDWRNVSGQGDFRCLQASGRKMPSAQTRFKIAADRDNLYIDVLCQENQMDKLRRSRDISKLWGSDTIEIFLAPSGQPDEFYQFAVSAGNLRYSMFYGEGGVVQPDPYLPFWTSKVFYGKNHWRLQIKIPFSAFYMTHNTKWNSQWLLNVARTRFPVRERSTWSPLKSGFRESAYFRKVTGFPKRSAEQDAAVRKVDPVIKNYRNGIYSGPLYLTVDANAAAAGKYALCVEEPQGKSSVHTVHLKSGLNKIVLKKVEYLRKKEGKTDLKLSFKSAKNGTSFGRFFPVDINYLPIQIELTSPGYKKSFYPGQDHSEIRGQLKLNLSDEQKKNAQIQLSISGSNLTKQTLTFNADKEKIPFKFDSRNLPVGGKALLTANVFDHGKVIASAVSPVTRLPENKGSVIRIENNVLIKNGKPWYPRTIYARGYLGGTLFRKRYETDQLGETNVKRRNVSPGRLIPGLESREATRDVKPCPELFEKIRKIVNKAKTDPEFDFYYICDEPEFRNISPVYLKYIYDFVSELDPYHPLMMCTTAGDKYLDTADVFTPHPYLNPIISDGKRILAIPVDRVRNYLQNVTGANRKDKVVGFTGQFFSYKFSNILADYPTWEELESSSWSAIVHGSRFHFPYAYHDLGDRPHIYEGYRYFNQSIKALESLLLSNRKSPVNAADPEKMIDTLLVEDGKTALLIVVNLKNAPQNTVISAERLKKYSSLLEFRGSGKRNIVNGTLKLALKPYECVILTSKKLDTGLKTRKQVLEKIAEMEKSRSTRGNLLFGKGVSTEVDSSNPVSFNNSLISILQQRNKLFDGTLDVLAWQSKTRSNKNWYELSFRKNPPRFSKVRLYGYRMGEPSVKIWKYGEWKKLTPKKITKTKNSVMLDFGEESRTVKVHITFPGKVTGDPIELYEIELLK